MFLFAGVRLSDGVTAEFMHTLVHFFMLERICLPFSCQGLALGLSQFRWLRRCVPEAACSPLNFTSNAGRKPGN